MSGGVVWRGCKYIDDYVLSMVMSNVVGAVPRAGSVQADMSGAASVFADKAEQLLEDVAGV